MRRIAEGRASGELVEELRELLLNFSESLRSEDLRARVLRLVPAFSMLRSIGASLVPVSGSDAARERMLAYLLRYQKVVIHGDELLVVSGIGEWARRIRELRTQLGWPIVSGGTLKAMIQEEEVDALEFGAERLLVDDYILLAGEPDRDAAHRWHVANSIRRRKESVKDKTLAFLRANVGRPVTGDELMYVAGNKTEWARRVRELRTEEGWAVVTKNTGRPDLLIGQYLLEHVNQSAPHDRHIPDDVRREVLNRDGFACRTCGWTRETWRPEDARNLELHHVQHHAVGGANSVDNLETLCNVCHDRRHAVENRRG